MTIIDPPVGPFHPPADISSWLDQLRAMPESRERDEAIDQAERWLADAR